VVEKIEPQRRFCFSWHPYAVDPKTDYSGEPPTLVEFTLEPIATGTRLRIVESGFDKLPPHRRDAALGDETRLSVLARLARGEPQSIARLTAGTRLTRQAVTKHLRVLEGAGVVRSVKVGRESRFALEPKPLDELRDFLDLVSRQWDAALARLKALVEG
jgi:DNA-binding transcriptional ArsR family regulator